MAIDLTTTYPGQIDVTDLANYPKGKAQNDVSPGDGQGTPLEKTWINDHFGFQQALLAAAGLTPSGAPDRLGASQYLDAIKFVARRELQKEQALNWPERASASDTAAANGDVAIAYGPASGPNSSPLFVALSSATRVFTSPDGSSSWDSHGLVNAAESSNPSVAYGLVNGSPGFVATWAAPTGHYTSTNGISWATVSATLPAHGVAVYAPSLGLWVLAGDLGIIYTSPTATAGSWTARSTPAAWQANCNGVKRAVWNGSLFVLLPLNTYGKFLTSPDGVNWTERTVATGTWVGLAYSAADQLWLALGIGAGAYSSPDGITWSFVTNTLATPNDLAVIGPLWVYPTNNGSFGGIAYSTNKGASWSYVAVGDHSVATGGWKRILAADGRFIVAHETGAALEFALSQRAL